MKILHILRAPMGGVLRHVRDLALAHSADGHQVGIVCDAPGTDGYNEAQLDQIESKLDLGLIRTPMSRSVGPGDIGATVKIRNIIREIEPDVVHGHGAKGGVYARVAGHLAGSSGQNIAKIYSPHGGSLHFDPASSKGKMYFRIESWLERWTDRLCFVAQYEEATYKSKIGQPRCDYSIVYNGLSEHELTPVETSKDAADLLFIGEMRMLKGPDLLLKALHKLKQKGRDQFQLLMVGDGPDRDAIKSMIDDLGLSSHVTTKPPMPAREAFGLAQCVVVPSRAEAMPYIVLEALGAHKPVITTKVGGIPEIFQGAENALIAPDVDALAEKLEMALTDEAALKALMPQNDQLRARFSITAMAANLLNVYQTSR